MGLQGRLSLLLVTAGVLAGALAYILYKLRRPRLDREYRRRTQLGQHGRMSDGLLTDVRENTLYYTYSIHGVDYAASQDVSRLGELLPEDHDRLIGPVTLKYSVRNPANSIVVCEEWSGLRIRRERIKSEQIS